MSPAAPMFSALTGISEVAALLGSSRAKLRYLLYRLPPKARYHTFSIRKKDGGMRVIQAPIPEILELQRRFHIILSGVAAPKHSTHGFAVGRSIITNARVHVGANILLNIDLEDFFPTIHFGRVRGRFMAKPFGCKKAVATILAQLCCHDGKLPQGAPTSPAISNLICGGLDVELQRFAAERQCRYTRYADDMTFSTKRKAFPEDMVAAVSPSVVGERLEEIIQRHGFRINRAKVRVQTRSQRQVVTGLKVNRFPNPSRKLFSQIRAMIHAREKFGLINAEAEFRRHVALDHRSPLRGPPSFLWALRGKIQFIGMVRGFSSPKFTNLARKLRELEPDAVKHWDIRNLQERISDALWILEDDEETCTQGTGFFLNGVGLITCRHVVHPRTRAFQAATPNVKFAVRIKSAEPTVDLAVCELDVEFPRTLSHGAPQRLKQGDAIILAGFPNFKLGNTPHIAPGIVVSSYVRSTIERLVIDTPIISGNSGGPVLNADGQVVGVAVTGTDRPDNVTDTADYGVIPIDALVHVTPVCEAAAE
jgi:RNA-directed DNA polymerase